MRNFFKNKVLPGLILLLVPAAVGLGWGEIKNRNESSLETKLHFSQNDYKMSEMDTEQKKQGEKLDTLTETTYRIEAKLDNITCIKNKGAK